MSSPTRRRWIYIVSDMPPRAFVRGRHTRGMTNAFKRRRGALISQIERSLTLAERFILLRWISPPHRSAVGFFDLSRISHGSAYSERQLDIEAAVARLANYRLMSSRANLSISCHRGRASEASR